MSKLLSSPYGTYLIICFIIFAVLIVALIILFKLYIEEKRANDEAGQKEMIRIRETERYKSEYFDIYYKYHNLLKKIKQLEGQEKTEIQQNKRLSYSEEDDYVTSERARLNKDKVRTNDDGNVKYRTEHDLIDDAPASVTFSPKYEYLEAANGGQFRKLLPSDEKSFFRTWEENGLRKFEFYGNVDNALANFNAVFDDVCVIEGKQNGATKIVNLDPGVLTSQLKVETPAKIKLI